MQQRWGLNVTVEQEIFTSNEELFEWITLAGKKYDVMFPTNHVVDAIKKGGFIYNLELAWIPNYANMWADFIHVPQGVASPDNLDQRLDPSPSGGQTLNTVSVPYFFGTTGIAFRIDKIPKADVEAIGLDFFTMPSYTPSNGMPTVTLTNKMRMLEDMRDVFTFGLKKAGQLSQQAQGIPFSPYTTDYTDTKGTLWKGTQWTSNETDAARVRAMADWLFRAKQNLFDFNSTEDTPSLIADVAVLNQAWSGDIAYAQRPDQTSQLPADFVLPYQGSRWWEDTCVIHSQSRNLWLAHEFINFIHNVDSPWQENQLLTRWNLYPTPNKACFDWLVSNPFPNGYDMTADVRLYPNLLAPDDWARCDIPRDVGTYALLNEYNPLWFDLTSV
jgi:spermidine/putrescine transport system substrate-binding protein